VSLGFTLDIELLETAANDASDLITQAAANNTAARAKLTVEFTAALDHSDFTFLNTSAATAGHLY